MPQTIPGTMSAVAINRFGGPQVLDVQTVPVPDLSPDEVRIRVEIAGVGEWDPFEREGGFAGMLGTEPSFPYVLGSEGAGVVAAVGERVDRFREGDRVYATGFLNPKGGFYAEYAAVNAELVAHIPRPLTTEQAGALLGVGITALRGLDDMLHLQPGESVLIFGASGGVGHVAVQLARLMGARVLAVASGADGAELAERVGADAAVNGRDADVVPLLQRFAPEGIDAALVTAGGAAADRVLSAVRDGGRVVYPNGMEPPPRPRPGVRLDVYDGDPDAEIIGRLNRLIESGPFEVHVARVFPLEQVRDAHRALDEHYLGKLALRIR